MSTYRAWDENDYPWPPPDGWYEGSDGKWWPEGYGPGPGTVIEPPPSAAAPAPDPVAPPAAAPAPAPAPVTPPPAAPVGGGYTPPAAAAPAPSYEPAYAASPAPATAGGGGGNGKILAIIGGLVGLLVLAGVGFFALSGGDDDDPGQASNNTEVPVATVGGSDSGNEGSDTTAAGSDTTTAAASDAIGSFDNPYDIGDGVVLFYDDFSTGEERRWLVEVLSPVADITQAVADENQFNDPPAAGEVFAAARVRITYESGPAPANVFDLSFGAIGPSGRVLKTFEATCGVTPDSLDSFAELFPGGSVEGNVCWATPSGDVPELRMILEASGVDGQVYVNLN